MQAKTMLPSNLKWTLIIAAGLLAAGYVYSRYDALVAQRRAAQAEAGKTEEERARGSRSIPCFQAEEARRDLVVRRPPEQYEIAKAKEQLALAAAKFGEHPNVASALEGLAKLYRVGGCYAEAEPYYKRALAIREKALGPHHPDLRPLIQALASLYELQGRFDDAVPLHKRSRAIREKANGQEPAGAPPKN